MTPLATRPMRRPLIGLLKHVAASFTASVLTKKGKVRPFLVKTYANTPRTRFVWLRSGPTEKMVNGMPVNWDTRSM